MCDIEFCCLIFIFIINIDVCLSLCNIIDFWLELLSDDLFKCYCYENKELLLLYVIFKLLILLLMLNFFFFCKFNINVIINLGNLMSLFCLKI